ncbi:FadR/GntR family transcriptional regulator [Henriciella litoralis]|uniref:FadR/GntR family transcriptional regulator n=1 Tax=Henriciella litoralis TaxID=568102 RepID=UPI00146EBFF9|nr:FCD domain-containing protein [Henriciella litoralis]
MTKEKGALRVAREIAKHIQEEKLMAGEKYLSEAEAIERYQVARGTLREALRHLQIQGVIEIRPGPKGGHFVADPTADNLASTIALLLQFSDATIESLIEARGSIEPGMAAMAAAHATEADIEAMDELLAEMEDSLGNYEAYYAVYMDLWDVLARSTRNAFFVFLSPALRNITWTAGIRPNERQRERALRNLQTVRDAVAKGDPEEAFQAMQLLERQFLATMREEYPREISKIVSWSDFGRRNASN